MKQYRKASGNELAAVLKEIQERMEQEFNVEYGVAFYRTFFLLNEKEECDCLADCIFHNAKMPFYAGIQPVLDLEKKFIRCIMTVFAFYDIVCVFSCTKESS